MTALNQTHDPAVASWVASANGHADFPLQNLPFGVFRRGAERPRGGVAIGDRIVDLQAAVSLGLFSGEAMRAAEAAGGEILNPLFDLPAAATSALRRQLFALLRVGGAGEGQPILVAQADVTMEVPVAIGAFTDFLCAFDHANRMSGGNLPPAFHYLPIAYNSRASSVVVSRDIRRPCGQSRSADGAVHFGPEPMLDFELELGVFLRSGNRIGETMTVAEARDAVFGYCLLNDWTARGIQFFETQPLGPFLGKSFATSISPWIVTAEALAPFRVAARAHESGAPAPFPYLIEQEDQARGNFDIELECLLGTERSRAAGEAEAVIVRTNSDVCYWTFAQMIAHHASNGCNLQPGDLLGSGTLSGPSDDSRACLAESTKRGTVPFTLPNGETRIYLADGDEITFTGRARRAGATPIGFGECRARVIPAATAFA